jgi:hypothetical protein
MPAAQGSSAFSMTYSEEVPNLEDQAIPLSLVDAITTEKRTYTRSQVEALLKRCSSRAPHAQAGLPGTSPR